MAGTMKASRGYYAFYVHRGFYNYLTYGHYFTEEGGPKDPPDKAVKRFKSQHDEYIEKYKKHNTLIKDKKLEESYQDILYNQMMSQDEQYSEIRKMAEVNKEQILKNIKSSIKMVGDSPLQLYDSTTLGKDELKKRQELQKVTSTSMKRIENKERISLSSLESIQKELINNINNLEKLGSKGLKSYKEAEEVFAKYQNNKDNMIKRIEENVKKLSEDVTKSGSFARILDSQKNTKVSYLELVELINTFGILPSLGNNLSNALGTAGEITGTTLEYIRTHTGNLGVSELTKKIMNQISKNSEANKYIDIDYKNDYGALFNSENDSFSFSELASTEKSTIGIKFAAHRNKTDMIISAEGSDLKKTKVSIKNSSNIDNVHIVDGTTLSALLGYIDMSGSFAGHYANMISVQSIDKNYDKAISNDVFGYRTVMENIIKEQSIINAFEGYSKGNAPELFMVFDNVNKKVHVIDMESIIGVILNNQKMASFSSEVGDIKIEGSDLKNLIIDFDKDFLVMTKTAESVFNKHKINMSISLRSALNAKS